MSKHLNTLVIGGGGFIGEHLVKQLVASGRTVTVLARSSVPRVRLAKGVRYLAGDFADNALVDTLMQTHGEVIHLAYATVPNALSSDPLADVMQNLPPAISLFELAARYQARLVFVSSGGTVYGHAESLPILETYAANPISSYGTAKLTIENYARLFHVSHALDVVCVRPANAYGAGQRPFSGQGFVATAMASAIQGQVVQIFGKTGTVRDYIYVTDLAAGIVAALTHGISGEIYNIGSGVGLNNLEVLLTMQETLHDRGFQVCVENMPNRPFDVRANILDCTKLHRQSGWRPAIPLTDGLRLTYDWLIEAGYA